MSGWQPGQRPITIAILAMGGEGGGVLADWIVALGEAAGHTAQSTSVAGVAQRTGATVYYIELFPPRETSASAYVRSEPVLSLFPAPGEVDIVIASELMEAGRAIARGLVTADRTVLVERRPWRHAPRTGRRMRRVLRRPRSPHRDLLDGGT